MTREELIHRLSACTWISSTNLLERTADFILENFTPKPKPTAVERLAELLFKEKGETGLSKFWCGLVANFLLGDVPTLKDILAQHDREVTDETIRNNGRGFGV